MRKRIIAVILAVSLTMQATACSGVDSIIEKEAVSSDGIVDSESITEGLYILRADGVYQQPNTDYQNFKGTTNSASRERLTWSVSGNKVIPVLYANDELVYYGYGSIPEYFDVEQFTGGAYTFGVALLSESSNGGVSVHSDGVLPGSDAATQLSNSLGKNRLMRFVTINGESIEGDRLSYSGSITGLEKNTSYDIGVYVGTYYAEVPIKADTRVFSSYKTTTTGGCKLTKDGYAVVDISSLEDGYYSINGLGLIEIRRSEERP